VFFFFIVHRYTSIPTIFFSTSDDDNEKESKKESAADKFIDYISKQAKELLRKRLIGQKVQVRRDYARTGRQDMPDKAFYTVKHKKANVAALVVEAGLVTVVDHGASDDRSLEYDELLQAEDRAKKVILSRARSLSLSSITK
jgi:hypothetical protein